MRTSDAVCRYPEASVGREVEQASRELRPITDVPRLEAEVLLSHVLGVSRTVVLSHPEQPLETGQLARYRELVVRRASQYPLPYLTGHAEFYGLDFQVAPDVLIPRPETEMLVDLALARRPEIAVDVGTGSGCIAVALASRLPHCLILATDISPAALVVARRNARCHRVGEHILFALADLLSACRGPVDVVVANPPYVSAAEWAALPASVRDHEPRDTLDGGPDGLAVIRRLLAQAARVLRPGGTAFVEIGAGQKEAVLRLAKGFFSEGKACVHPDLAGRDRVLEVQT